MSHYEYHSDEVVAKAYRNADQQWLDTIKELQRREYILEIYKVTRKDL